jgi:tetrahydromethanopterin S-methyltransferase subunit B
MSNIQIESDLKEILNRIEKRFDKVDEKFEKLDNHLDQLEKKLDGKIDQLENKLGGKIDQLDGKVDDINLRLTKVETKLDSELPAMQKSISEIKGSQQAQIWTLIGILITAVGGFLVAVGRFVLSGNP